MKKQSKVQYILSQILATYLFLPGRMFSLFVILLLSVFVLDPSNSFSQKGSMEVSVFAGPNYSDFRGNEVLEEKNDPQIYYSGGIGFQYNIINNLAIRTNIAYERKGIGSEGMVYDGTGKPLGDIQYRDRFDYLSIPIHFRAQFGDQFRFFASAGAYWAYLIKESTKTSGVNMEDKITDMTDNFTSSDYGIVGGIGAQYHINPNFLIETEIRYNYGLANISDKPVVNDGSIKTSSACLLFGLAYKISQ